MKRKKPSQPEVSSPPFASSEMEHIEQLLRFMTEHNLEEFEYSRGDLRIRLRKPTANTVVAQRSTVPEIIVPGEAHGGATHLTSPPSGSGQQSSSGHGAPAPAEGRSGEDLYLVKSPIVGTFYESPSPGSEAFVKVGSHVTTGQTLCIVEAMKLMNEIESDATGEIVRIFVENGQPVEYGQPLFGVRPSRKR